MAHVIVVGGGVAGLGTTLALARNGNRVTILERDDTPLPEDPEGAFAWDRSGAPQVRHSHALLGRLRNILRDRYPDVLEALLAAGATEIRFTDPLPPDIVDRSALPGDEDLVALACRRTTFEWTLRRSVLETAGVELIDGVGVAGLVSVDNPSGPPTVTGVRTDDDRTFDADLVVVANGRRSSLPDWLAPHGVEVTETTKDTGIVYLSRFYRFRDGFELPRVGGVVALDLGYLKVGLFLGDNRTFSVTLATADDDREFRKLLRDPETFDEVLGNIPGPDEWFAGNAEPLTDVNIMASLINRRREFLADDTPLVHGLVAVGDAHTCTNPLYGRGCSLAMVQATLLADAVSCHPDDMAAATLAYERSSIEIVLPWYEASVAADRSNAKRRGQEGRAVADVAEAADPAGPTIDPEDFMRSVMAEGLMPAVRTDAVVFRAFVRGMNLLAAPDELFTDADVIGRVMQVWQTKDSRPEPAPPGPDRATMLAALR